MSYVKYANLCAEMVRVSLKEPFLTKVRPMDGTMNSAGPRGAHASQCFSGEAQGDCLLQEHHLRGRQADEVRCVSFFL